MLALVRSGAVTGLRVDHPDGLRDPAGYLARLQREAATAGRPVWIVIEKILSPGEGLPTDWGTAVHGTTGYNFLNDLNAVFVDRAAEPRLAATFTRLTGETGRARRRPACRQATRARDDAGLRDRWARPTSSRLWTTSGIHDTARRVLVELIAAFPIYRTYVTDAGPSASDLRAIEVAVRGASRRHPEDASGSSTWSAADSARRPEPPDPPSTSSRASSSSRGRPRRRGLRTPCATGCPSCCRSTRWVVSRPSSTTVVRRFHAAAASRRADWPLEMLATSTHDTKRGEDARARLNALSELPEEWDRAVTAWFALNGQARQEIAGAPASDPDRRVSVLSVARRSLAPDASRCAGADGGTGDLVERVARFMRKAIREAKDRTSWQAPDAAYEGAVDAFVRSTLSGPAARPFLASFAPFLRRVSAIGVVNALAQVVLKVGSPGVPDFYQGTELWHLSLVDPDNRRPLDFAAHRRALARLAPAIRADAPEARCRADGRPAPGRGLDRRDQAPRDGARAGLASRAP